MTNLAGDWTHRRGDLLGSRFVRGNVGEWKPKVAWTWAPSHGGRVDQVRIFGQAVLAVSMPPGPPGWTHALVHLIDGRTGKERTCRRLPDPAPVGAIAVGPRAIHVAVAGDAVAPYHYTLDRETLRPLRRTALPVVTSGLEDDVLDLWAPADDRVAFEVELGAERARRFGWVDLASRRSSLRAHEASLAEGNRGGPPRDGAVSGEYLVVAVPGIDGPPATAAGLARTGVGELGDGRDANRQSSLPPDGVWMPSNLTRPVVASTVVAEESSVTGVFGALAAEAEGELEVEVQTIDRASSVVRQRHLARLPGAPSRLFSGFRAVRIPAGALFIQPSVVGGASWGLALKVVGGVSTADGVLLGARGSTLAFGTDDALVVVREKSGALATLAALDVASGGGLQGRRARGLWALDLPEIGEGVVAYGGAPGVVLRSSKGLTAVAPA